MTETFTPLASLLGGALIGLAASLLLLGRGRVAGISGIAGDALRAGGGEGGWRWSFLAGLVLTGGVAAVLVPDAFGNTLERGPAVLVAAGLLVGVGTRLGDGCTSGHGVCGLSRLSTRSLAAVLTFMLTGGLTVLAFRVLGGAA